MTTEDGSAIWRTSHLPLMPEGPFTLTQQLTRREWTAAIAILAIVSALMVGTFVPNQPELTLFDEWVYLDAVDQASSLGVAQRGEPILGEALEVISCRGVQFYGLLGSPCNGPYVSTEYPQGGITGADIHPPTYFWLTAGVAAAIRSLGISEDLLTSSRLAGALWLFLGLLGITILGVELGARLMGSVGAAAAVAALPLTRYTNTYITPDNLNLAVGAAVMLTGIRFCRGTWPWWSLFVAGALAGLFKTQNALVVGAAVSLIGWHWLTTRNQTNSTVRLHIAAAAGAASGFVVVQLAWQVARSLLAVGDSPAQPGVSVPLSAELLYRETTSFLFRLVGSVTDDADPTVAYFSAALLVAGCAGAVLYRPVKDFVWGAAAATLLMLVLGSPILIVVVKIVVGDAIPSPARYGGSLLPGMAAITATAFPSRSRAIGLASFGLVAVAAIATENLMN